MRLAAIIHNLKQGVICLKPGGRIWASFFIIDDLYDPGYQGLEWRFDAPFDQGYTANDKNPEKCVGFSPETINRALDQAGLVMVKYIPGTWKTQRTSLDQGIQDVILARAR
jgi:hypothetical protein